MIELFGFWATVTMYTAMLSGIVLTIGYAVGCLFCDYVTEKEGILRDKVLKHLKDKYTDGSIYGARDLLGNILLCTSAVSVCTWLCTCIAYNELGVGLIGVVSTVATFCAPILAWPALIITFLVVIAKGSRKVYRMWSKLEAKLKTAE